MPSPGPLHLVEGIRPSAQSFLNGGGYSSHFVFLIAVCRWDHHHQGGRKGLGTSQLAKQENLIAQGRHSLNCGNHQSKFLEHEMRTNGHPRL